MHPALGENLAAAAVVSIVFLLMAVFCVRNSHMTHFRLYMVGGALAATLRGIAYAIRAASILENESNSNENVVYMFFTGAGFGIANAIQALLVAGWLRNTLPAFKPAAFSRLRVGVILMLPVAIVFGPILGLAATLLVFGSGRGEADDLDTAASMRNASTVGLLVVASVVWLTALWGTLNSLATSQWHFNPKKYPQQMISVILVSGGFLVWSAAYRLAIQYTDHTLATRERLFYPLNVLPELLQCFLWTVPTLMSRVHLSNRFQEWWVEGHPGGEMPTGGFALPQIMEELDVEVAKLLQ